MKGKDKLLAAIESMTIALMEEKGWNRRRARRAAEAKVGRHLRRALRTAKPGAPVIQTLGKMRLLELGETGWHWVLTRGVYLLVGLAIGGLLVAVGVL